MPWTLVDLAADLAPDELARACHEAGVRYRTRPKQVDAVLARRPNARGTGNLRKVMHGDVLVTLSKLGAELPKILTEAGLPLPQMNRRAGGRRVDCRWPEHGITLELNSYRYHSSRYAWAQDQRRQREAYARDDEFRSYTYDDVFERPELVINELRALLPARRRGEQARPRRPRPDAAPAGRPSGRPRP